MPSTIYDKGNWQFDDNRDIPAAQEAAVADMSRYQLWYLKAFLMGQIGGATKGLWTCYYSCDSVTAGTAADGVDRWGSTFDITKIVRGNTTAVRSWFVLRSPLIGGSYYYMILECTSVNAYQVVISFSKNAPTGGSTTVRPTATDEWSPAYNTQPDTSTTLAFYSINSNTVSSRRMHGKLSPDGSFCILSSRNNVFDFALMFWYMSRTKSGDQYPVWTMCAPIAAAANTSAILINATNSIDRIDSTGAVFGRNYDGASIVANAVMIPNVQATTVASLFTSGWNNFDVIDGAMPDFPCFIVAGSTSATLATVPYYLSQRGRLDDMSLCVSLLAPAGTVERDSQGNIRSWAVGALWLPGSTNPIV